MLQELITASPGLLAGVGDQRGVGDQGVAARPAASGGDAAPVQAAATGSLRGEEPEPA